LERPVRPARKRTAHHNVTAAVIWGDPRPGVNGDQPIVLIARRPANAMLGGMWKFPGGKQREGESLAECLQREIREELDFKVSVDCHLVTIEHAYTHFRISLHAFHCHPVNGEPRPVQVADLRWVTLAELAEYPFPVTDQKIIAALAQSDR
jgi:A/G-specific adenine glycosylase